MGHGMGGWADGLAGAWCGETGSKISHWSMEDLPECMCVARLFANAVVCVPSALRLLALSPCQQRPLPKGLVASVREVELINELGFRASFEPKFILERISFQI